MKKLLLLSVAMMMSFAAFAECPTTGGDGSTKADAIDFCWEEGHDQYGSGTYWYHVDLSPLYQEEVPTLTFCLQNPTLMDTVEVKMKATVAGQVVEREYKILPGQTKSQTGNASLLLKAKQTEVFVALTTKAKDENAHVHFSARLYDAIDLDEACENAVAFDWKNGFTQKKGAIQWVKIDLKDAKKAAEADPVSDVKISITNQGSDELKLRAAQSLDCPSSGLTKHSHTIAAGATVVTTIPAGMIKSVSEDELYVTFDNSQPIKVQAELVPRAAGAKPLFDFKSVTVDSLPVVTNQTIAAGKHYYRINVAQMNDSLKYEPEFTFLGLDEAAVIDRKMSFEEEVWFWQGNVLPLAANEEHIEVIKKNVVQGINAKYIYLAIENDKPFQLIGRYKHVREGKACKTNIDFDWTNGHVQEGKTTQWYAIDVTAAKEAAKDIKVTIENIGYDKATVKGSLAFSCPYIDLQEITRSIAAGKSISTKIGYATYAMMSETIYVGAETNQDIRIKAELVDAEGELTGDACLEAKEFNWQEGAKQDADVAVWYKLGLNEVREMAVMPTINVFNLSKDKAVKIEGLLSLECPDTKPNQERSMTIAANGVYSKQLSKDMFANMTGVDTLYLRVKANQPIAFEVALTEEPEGSSCTSAINFNWERGNDQKAKENLWYRIDLRKAMQTDKDVKITLVNKDSKNACEGVIQVAFDCNVDAAPQIQKFTLAAGASRSTVQPHSMLESAVDSVVIVRLLGSTALHVEAQLVDPEPFDPIACDELIALEWDKVYTQEAGTKMYLLTKEVMAALNAEATSATAFINELSGKANSIKAEVAYHCPITSKPMTKTISLSANQKYSKAIGENLAKQAAAHDSLIIRLTSKEKFEFEARLVKTDDGASITTPIRIKFNEPYEQKAGTTCYYRINTEQLKATPELNHGSRVHVWTNTLAAAATLKVKVYEDIAKMEDLLEDRGKRTIGKGKGFNRELPAYEIFGVADKIVTIEVTTDQDIKIGSQLSTYPKLAADKVVPLAGRDENGKPNAQFVVPNIDYIIPAGGQWFALCLPYLRNNYKITKDANFAVTNIDGVPVTVEATATFEDTLHYAIPHRSRKINKKGSYTKTFLEAIDEAIARRGYSYSIASTDPNYIDSMAREIVTSDSLTAYLYINVDHPISWRINMERTTAYSCDDEAMMQFDWEHGNFQEAGQTMWYQVAMDEWRIPENKDLRLHVQNWADEKNAITASFFEACKEMAGLPKMKTVDFAAKQDSALTIPREWIKNIGWANYQIQVSSEKAAYIWAELVEPIKHDTIIVKNPTMYPCDGETVQDQFGIDHIINAADPASLTWQSKVIDGGFNEDHTMIIDTIYADSCVVPAALVLPDIATILPSLEVKKGEAIDLTAAKAALVAALDNGGDESKQAAKEIHWEVSSDCTTFTEIDATPIATEAISVRFRVISDCDEELISGIVENKIQDVVSSETQSACHEYTWAETGDTYYETQEVVVEYDVPVGCGNQKEHHKVTLNLTITNKVVNTLVVDNKYDRILMVDRQQLLDLGWTVDELPEFAPVGLVKWFFNDAEISDPKYNNKGYYLTYENGEYLPNGKYKAVVDLDPNGCGKKAQGEATLNHAAAAAPALMPTLAQPGEDIKVLNLDPEQTTIIRIYTSDGLIQGTYTATGAETYTIKAAADHGFYMVELSNEGLKTTLRYIVK